MTKIIKGVENMNREKCKRKYGGEMGERKWVFLFKGESCRVVKGPKSGRRRTIEVVFHPAMSGNTGDSRRYLFKELRFNASKSSGRLARAAAA